MEEQENEELKFKNELERLKMQAEFGAMFSKGDSELPPEIEAQWLENIRKFEESYENTPAQKLKDILGNPSLTPVSNIADANIENELEKLLEMLGEKGVEIDHDEAVTDRELYRFITEDLMEHEMYLYTEVPGMVTHIIYEEFYPNHAKDIISHCNDFFRSYFKKDAEWLTQPLVKEIKLKSGLTLTEDEFKVKAQLFFDAYKKLKLKKLEFEEPVFNVKAVIDENGDKEFQGDGAIRFMIDYDCKLEDGTKVTFAGEGNFEMTIRWNYWQISKLDFPGLKEWAG